MKIEWNKKGRLRDALPSLIFILLYAPILLWFWVWAIYYFIYYVFYSWVSWFDTISVLYCIIFIPFTSILFLFFLVIFLQLSGFERLIIGNSTIELNSEEIIEEDEDAADDVID
ncbi:MAG: hypothetical protein LBP59_13145 [Planctomycetaceae bacterium]|jgi:hypothetical protein|nr:hypothetical protein [Planctomycetaceae bacterium]